MCEKQRRKKLDNCTGR